VLLEENRAKRILAKREGDGRKNWANKGRGGEKKITVFFIGKKRNMRGLWKKKNIKVQFGFGAKALTTVQKMMSAVGAW